MNPEQMGSFSFRPKEIEIFSNYKPEGSIIPMVTPAIPTENGTDIDEASFKNLANYLIEGTNNYPGGIFILGSQGEFRSLSFDHKLLVIDYAQQVIQDRLPILVGISAPDPRETKFLAQIAHSKNASALVIAPLYGNGALFEKMEAASQGNLPIILYNNPPIHSGGYKGQDLSIEMINSIREKFPQVVGIKDSTSNPRHLEEVLQLKGINLLHGSTRNAKNNWGSATGGVFAFANVHPKEAAYLIDRVRKDQLDQEAKDSINAFRQGLGTPTDIKLVLKRMGIISAETTFGNPT